MRISLYGDSPHCFIWKKLGFYTKNPLKLSEKNEKEYVFPLA